MTEVIYALSHLEADAYKRLKAEGRIIVRRRDCRLYERAEEPRVPRCARTSRITGDDDFCSRGDKVDEGR